MSWRLWKPRPISSFEAAILRRMLWIDPQPARHSRLVDSIDHLIVHDEGGGDDHNDSLEFIPGQDLGNIVASALGTMANGGVIELYLWDREEVFTYLELEPHGDTRRPIRMPILETIRPWQTGCEEGEESEQNGEMCS